MSKHGRRAIISYLHVALVVIMFVSMAGCGAGEQAGSSAARQAGRVAHGLDDAGRGARTDSRQLAESGITAAEEARMRAAAGSGADNVVAEARHLSSPYTSDLSEDQARFVIKVACAAVDIAEAGKADSWGDAAGKAFVSFGGRYTRSERIADFARDLDNGQNATDQIRRTAGFLLCELV
jgi:hypothetical protein